MKQSFKSKAINAVISAIVRTLRGWAEEWGNNAYFFLVIGDKNCSDVAWYNTKGLARNGAFTVASFPQSAAAFVDLNTSCDILIDEQLKNKEFCKVYGNITCTKDNYGWFSIETETGDETDENNNESKKGGAQ